MSKYFNHSFNFCFYQALKIDNYQMLFWRYNRLIIQCVSGKDLNNSLAAPVYLQLSNYHIQS